MRCIQTVLFLMWRLLVLLQSVSTLLILEYFSLNAMKHKYILMFITYNTISKFTSVCPYRVRRRWRPHVPLPIFIMFRDPEAQ